MTHILKSEIKRQKKLCVRSNGKAIAYFEQTIIEKHGQITEKVPLVFRLISYYSYKNRLSHLHNPSSLI